MRHKDVARRFLIAASLGGLFVTIAAAQSEPPVTDKREVRLLSANGPEFQKQAAEMRRKLVDPELRKALRAEQRASIESQHPGLAEALEITPDLHKRLIDLLTDEQMKHLDLFYAEQAQPFGADSAKNYAAAETRKNQQLRELLGEERYVRYLDYREQSPSRQRLAYYEARLDPQDKLTADQTERLRALLQKEWEESLARRSGMMRNPFGRLAFSASDREASLRKANIELNEDGFRRLKEDSRLLLKQLADILTPAQFKVFERIETEKIAGQRKYVQQMRVSAGMAPEFDETLKDEPDADSELKAGRVRLELSVRANNSEPVKASVVTENGKAAAQFEGPEGLWVEATPSLLNDGSGQVNFKFYESVNGKRRALSGSMGTGILPQQKDTPLGMGGGSGSTFSGLQTYEIFVNVQITAL
jgi:hypothetical protein